MIEKECGWGLPKGECGGPKIESCSQISSLYHQRLHGGDWSCEDWDTYLKRLGEVLQGVRCPHRSEIEDMGRELNQPERTEELV